MFKIKSISSNLYLKTYFNITPILNIFLRFIVVYFCYFLSVICIKRIHLCSCVKDCLNRCSHVFGEMSKRNNLLHCVKCSDNRHPLLASGKSTEHAPQKRSKQPNIQTPKHSKSQTSKHDNVVDKNRKRRLKQQANNVDKRKGPQLEARE